MNPQPSTLSDRIVNATDFFTRTLRVQGLRGKFAATILFKKAKKCQNINSAINLCYTAFTKPPTQFIGWKMQPFQVKTELEQLLKIIRKRRIDNLMEIGSANGGTFWLFSRVIEPDATLISLDLPGGKFGGGSYQKLQDPFFKNFCLPNQQVFCVRDDSHSSSTLENIKKLLTAKKLDFLFIDGDHTYQGVRQDFEMYRPLVKKSGLIGFHDIVDGPSESVGGVPQFWREIKEKYPHQEIVESNRQNKYGIGLLFV